jgi:hypothetical protein
VDLLIAYLRRGGHGKSFVLFVVAIVSWLLPTRHVVGTGNALQQSAQIGASAKPRFGLVPDQPHTSHE